MGEEELLAEWGKCCLHFMLFNYLNNCLCELFNACHLQKQLVKLLLSTLNPQDRTGYKLKQTHTHSLVLVTPRAEFQSLPFVQLS